mgnify:FL=1
MLATLFPIILILTALFSSLVAGFLFAFAIVVMPGIKNLSDGEFIRAFQEMDGIIQNNQPLFMVMWGGSILAIIISAIMGFWQLDSIGRVIMIIATLLYIFGVQFPTITINVPLNNQLQKLTTHSMSADELQIARSKFEPRWNQANIIRTGVATLVSVMLLSLLVML